MIGGDLQLIFALYLVTTSSVHLRFLQIYLCKDKYLENVTNL